MPFDREAAKRAGYSDAEIDAYLAEKEAAEPKGLIKNPAMREVARAVLKGLPPAGATGGAILGGFAGAPAGGVGALPGSVIGAGAGGSGGHIVADIGSNFLLGEPYSDPMTELGETGMEFLTSGALQAIGGRIFGVPGKPGAISETAMSGSNALRNRAAKQAIERNRAMRRAGNVDAEVQEAVEQATEARRATGRELGETLANIPGEVNVGNIADDVIAMQKASFGGSAISRNKMVQMVRDRLREVLPEYTTGAVKGNNLVLDLTATHRAQRAFDQLSRTAYGQASRGITPKPDLDRMIANALRQRLAAADEAIPALKERSQAAIRTHQDVLRESRRARSEPVERLRALREDRRAAAAARMPGGMPTPTIGLSGPWIHPPAVSDVLEYVSKIANDPRVYAPLSQGPRVLDLLMQQADVNQLRQLMGTEEQ